LLNTQAGRIDKEVTCCHGEQITINVREEPGIMARISKAQLIKLQKKFRTDAKIGEMYGITRQAVHQLRKKYGIDSSIADNPERNAKIVKQYKGGTSGTTLAKKFKLSVSQTYRVINEAMAGKKKKRK
jgi:DNA invertase Pin-like site-specific DNA recombinase